MIKIQFIKLYNISKGYIIIRKNINNSAVYNLQEYEACTIKLKELKLM